MNIVLSGVSVFTTPFALMALASWLEDWLVARRGSGLL